MWPLTHSPLPHQDTGENRTKKSEKNRGSGKRQLNICGKKRKQIKPLSDGKAITHRAQWLSDAQTVSEQWPPGREPPHLSYSSTPFFFSFAEHDVIWYRISLWSICVSCPSCVHLPIPGLLAVATYKSWHQTRINNCEIKHIPSYIVTFCSIWQKPRLCGLIFILWEAMLLQSCNVPQNLSHCVLQTLGLR